MVETVIQDFEHAADNIKVIQCLLVQWRDNSCYYQSFNSVLDETNQLLDLWTQILSQTQHTKQLIETAVVGPVAGPSIVPSPAVEVKKRKAPPISSKAPVGTHMTKRRKT
jgi:hypothetical protein